MVRTWACIQGVLKMKVKVKGHVIRTILWFHENPLFSQDHDQTCTRWSPVEPASRMLSRSRSSQMSRDTDTFLTTRKSLLLAGKWLYREQTCTQLSPDGPASRVCSRSRSRSKVTDTGTSVMSRNVCYTVPSDVLSLHALTLRITVTLSFQYKCQKARCNVYIMELATPSLTVWLNVIGLPLFCLFCQMVECTVVYNCITIGRKRLKLCRSCVKLFDCTS